MAPPLPNLRIKLRASKRVAQKNRSRPKTTPPPIPEQEGQTPKFQTPPQAPPELVKKSRRQKLKEKNPHKYELLREYEMKRSQLYRLEMRDTEKEHSNQLAKIRQRRYRQRKNEEKEAQRKEEEKRKIKYGNRRKTRNDHLKELDMRKKETERKRKYRQNRTAEQYEEEKRRRREAYAAKKERERQERLERERTKMEMQIQREMEQQASLQYLDLPHFPTSSAARRKRLSRVKQLLPSDSTHYAEVVVDMISKTTPRKQVALKNAGVINDRKRRSLELELTNIVAKEAKIKGRKKFMTAALEDLKKARLQRYASRQLGINRKAITKGSKKKTGRKQVSQVTVDLVKNFYEQVAHSVPCKKLVSKKTGKPRMVLGRSIDEVYGQFKEVYPHVKIGRSAFCNLRPNHVKPQSHGKYYGCLCEQCENIRLKVVALDQHLQTNGHNELKLKDAKAVVNMTLCDKAEDEKFHQLSCIKRNCESCGIKHFRKHCQSFGDQERSKPIIWKKWSTVEKKLKTKTVKRKALVTLEKNVGDLLQELEKELESYSLHLFNWHWQAAQFRTIRSNLPNKWILNVWDFAENYTCITQNEAQSAYWTRNQVTIHPIVNYYHCETEGCNEEVKEAVVFISSDNTHDFNAVHTYMDMLTAHLHEKRNLTIEKMVRFSDGCGVQYKSRGPLADIANSSLDYNFPTNHNYFGSRHGKGPSDGESAVVKSKASMAVKSGRAVISTAKELFDFCSETLEKDVKDGDSCTHQRRSFFLVDEDDVKRNRERCEIKTVKGTRSIYSVTEFRGEGDKIKARYVSCFCKACLTGDEKECKNADYVSAWTVIPLTHQFKKGSLKGKKTVTLSNEASDQAGDDEASDQPVDDDAGDQSGDDDGSDQSGDDEGSDQPIDDDTSDQSGDDKAIDEPVYDDTSDQSGDDDTSDHSGDDEASDQSRDDEASDQPVDDDASDQSWDDEASDHSRDDEASDQPVDDDAGDQSGDDDAGDQSGDDDASDRPIDNDARDQSGDESDVDENQPGVSGWSRLSTKTKPETPATRVLSTKPTAEPAAPCKPTKPAVPCMEPSRCVNQESRRISVGNFVAVKAGHSKWYTGQVLSIDEERGEAEINFLKKVTGENYFIWPDKDDKAWQPSWVSITTIIPITPPQVTQRGTKKWPKEEMASIDEIIKKLNT